MLHEVFLAWTCFLSVITIVLLSTYLVRLVAAFVRRRSFGRAHFLVQASEKRRWMVLPICYILAVSTLIYNWPLQMRFRASQAALEGEAKRLLNASSGRVSANRWIKCDRFFGLYHIDAVLVSYSGRGVYFATYEDGLLGTGGFDYSENGAVWHDVGLPPGWGVFRMDP